MVAHLLLSLGLMRVFSHGGLALANSIAVTLEVAGLLWIARGRLGGVEGSGVLASALRCALAAAVMGAVLVALRSWWRGSSPLALGLGGTLLGGVVYLGAALALGCEEIKTLVGIVQRR